MAPPAQRGQPGPPPPPPRGAAPANGGRPPANGGAQRPQSAGQKPQGNVNGGSATTAHFSTPAPVVHRSKPDAEGEYAQQGSTGPPGLRDALMDHRIVLQSYTPGQHRIICPTCNGGSTGERSLAVHVEDDGKSAAWMCHRANCEWSGGTGMDGRTRASKGADGATSNRRVAKPKLPAPEDLQRASDREK